MPLDALDQQQLLSYHESQPRLFKLNLYSLMREEFLNDILITCRSPIHITDCGYSTPGVPLDRRKTSAFMEALRMYTYGGPQKE
ncbi:MAG: hypothetical protein Q8O99_01820 [bacterium]|nr:hypothetical protein [bacterium]